MRNISKHYSEFVTHNIHLRTIEISEVETPDYDADEERVDLKVEDREKKKEENYDLEVLAEDFDRKNDNGDDEDSPKNTNDVMNHFWEEVNSKQYLWTRSKDDITKEEY